MAAAFHICVFCAVLNPSHVPKPTIEKKLCLPRTHLKPKLDVRRWAIVQKFFKKTPAAALIDSAKKGALASPQTNSPIKIRDLDKSYSPVLDR